MNGMEGMVNEREVHEEMNALLEFVRKEQISMLYTIHPHSWLTHTYVRLRATVRSDTYVAQE